MLTFSASSLFDYLARNAYNFKSQEEISSLCEDLYSCDLLVIDDGSGEEFAPIFAKAAQMPGVTLLRHSVNRGKGAALKTALTFFKVKNWNLAIWVRLIIKIICKMYE